MANGITQGLTDLLGIDTNAGDKEMQQALAALQAVGVPTAEMLKLPELEKYVSAGVLTPQQYQSIIADPEAYTNAIASNQDNTGKDAQASSLDALNSIINSGGSTAINDANLKNNLAQTNQAMQASRGGIEDDAKQRGVYGGGLEFINKLMNEQGNAESANLSATNAAANNAKLALDAISQRGSLGGQMQGQSNQAAQAQAEAAQQIAEYNSQLQSSANQYNTQTANAAQAGNLANSQDIANKNTSGANDRMKYNAQIPQTIFQDQMAKAGATADAYGNQSKLQQQQEQMGAGLTGGLLGAGATVYGDSLKAKAGNYAHGGTVDPCYAKGGEVHDHQLCMEAGGPVPGDESGMPPMQDDESQDTVDAHLSPGEVVLPRSISQAPDAPGKAADFMSRINGQSAQGPGNFSDLLAKLEENGLELRLTSKGM